MWEGGWWSYIKYDEKHDRPTVSWMLLKRVADYARPYWLQVVFMLVSIFGVSGLTVVPPLLYRDLIDHALPSRDFARLNLLAAGMIVVPVLSGLFGVLQRYMSSIIGEGIIYDLRRALFEHLQRMSLRFFTNTRTGELMSRLNNDVVGSQQAITSTSVSLVSNVVAVIATLAIMLSLEWRLTLVSVAILPAFIFPARHVARILRRITRDSFNFNAQMNSVMNETLNVSGALLAKVFGRIDDENHRFAQKAQRVRDVGIRQALVGRWFFLGISLVSAFGTAIVFWLGGYLVLTSTFTIGTIVAFSVYLTQLYGPLSALTNARVEFATSMVSFERVFEVLDMPLEIYEKPDAKELRDVKGDVRFEDVSFTYAAPAGTEQKVFLGLPDVDRFQFYGHGAVASGPVSRVPVKKNGAKEDELDGPAEAPHEPRWALKHVTFEVRPGQLAALVGPSGAGKTTITYLLPRLYDPTEGRVLIDGNDLRDVTLKSLSDQIGIVTQETYLFHDTIRANLLYARPDATQEELEEACRAANIHEFILDLPDGYDTVVGERGYRLSGGEKQRVAIARVVLKDPQILILDEATSHLDSQSEALIQTALERVMKGRTSLVIAHRLSTVLAADVILVMEHGELVERGKHEELLERGGVYAGLYHTQFRARPTAAATADDEEPSEPGESGWNQVLRG